MPPTGSQNPKACPSAATLPLVTSAPREVAVLVGDVAAISVTHVVVAVVEVPPLGVSTVIVVVVVLM